jgi:DNA-binding NarL/FixJ family response regulator
VTAGLRDVALALLRTDVNAEAAEHWSSLVSGAWSLVDQFDRDGRRYVVAIRKRGTTFESLSDDERIALAARAEGTALRTIASVLGLSVPTISRRIRRGMEKLGISSQAELARLLAPSQCSSAPRSGPAPTSCVCPSISTPASPTVMP